MPPAYVNTIREETLYEYASNGEKKTNLPVLVLKVIIGNKKEEKMNAIERIDQAFLQLEFAIKLMNYIELKKINQEDFDCSTIVLLQGRNVSFGNNSFNSYNDLILAAQNNYIITLGFSAIVLEASLHKAGIENNPEDFSPEGQLRTLVYMIRCAFAHDMMTPRWKIKPRYQQVLKLNLHNKIARIDLRNRDGTSFEDVHIGGIDTYYEIKDAVRKLIEKKIASTNSTPFG